MGGDNSKYSNIRAGQLALDLPVEKSFAREDLVRGKANSTAVDLIDAWPNWPGSVVILAGPVGCGKSHIGGVWANKCEARILPMKAIGELSEDRENKRALLLEDADGSDIEENALFHILNAKRSANASIVITSRNWPSDWNIELADLSSRLRAAQLVEIGEPDDELLSAVLYKLFADRQLQVDLNVVEYLVVRMERSLEAANQIVARMDAVALAQKRNITRKLAAKILTEIESTATLNQLKLL
ncbi:MAG: DnaA/Hda family protein [Rhizobiaceae bacterium]|nr:DnaA/Hda family protein [Rhizobiaceae bacterium]